MNSLPQTSRAWLIKSIRCYQVLRLALDSIIISAFGVAIACKHTPTCSEYAIQQIKIHGTIRGLLRGGYRILTCW